MAGEDTFTPGPWRSHGKLPVVVADHPAPGIRGSDETAYYGGHLICESVNEANARVITAAPDMVHALKLALEYWQHRQQRYKNRSPIWVQEARAALAKIGGAA